MKIALTATPALHTTEIFGQPVFKYTYREDVIEGYLVDHDAPHHLETKLSTGDIHYKSVLKFLVRGVNKSAGRVVFFGDNCLSFPFSFNAFPDPFLCAFLS